MKFADAVLIAIPSTYLLVAVGLLPFDASVYDAVLAASLAVAAIIGHALFVNPPR